MSVMASAPACKYTNELLVALCYKRRESAEIKYNNFVLNFSTSL